MTDFKQLAEQYKSELLDKVIPFWLEKSQDKEFGGYFTCLDRDGSVYDTDKFETSTGISRSIAKAIRWLSRTTFSLIPLLSLLSDS